MKKLSEKRGPVNIRSIALTQGIRLQASHDNMGYRSIFSRVMEAKSSGEVIIYSTVFDFKDKEKYENVISILTKVFLAISAVMWIVSFLATMKYENYIEIYLCVFTFSSIVLIFPKSMTRFILRTFIRHGYLEESKFKGALYQVLNAFYDLGRVPNIEELEKYSIYSKYDEDYVREIRKRAPFIVIGTVMSIDWGSMWLRVLATFIILAILEFVPILYYLESMVVSKPKTKHQEVAIFALEMAIEDLEKKEKEVFNIDW